MDGLSIECGDSASVLESIKQTQIRLLFSSPKKKKKLSLLLEKYYLEKFEDHNLFFNYNFTTILMSKLWVVVKKVVGSYKSSEHFIYNLLYLWQKKSYNPIIIVLTIYALLYHNSKLADYDLWRK